MVVAMGYVSLTVVTLILIGAVATTVWWVTYGKRVAWCQAARYVGEFSSYAAKGAVLDIRHLRSKRTIQFALACEETPAVEFAFPDMSWSSTYFDKLVARLEKAGFPCTIEIAPTRSSPVRRFASVILSGPTDHLVDRSRHLLDIVAGFLPADSSDDVKIRFRGVVRASAIAEARARKAR